MSYTRCRAMGKPWKTCYGLMHTKTELHRQAALVLVNGICGIGLESAKSIGSVPHGFCGECVIPPVHCIEPRYFQVRKHDSRYCDINAESTGQRGKSNHDTDFASVTHPPRLPRPHGR